MSGAKSQHQQTHWQPGRDAYNAWIVKRIYAGMPAGLVYRCADLGYAAEAHLGAHLLVPAAAHDQVCGC